MLQHSAHAQANLRGDLRLARPPGKRPRAAVHQDGDLCRHQRKFAGAKRSASIEKDKATAVAYRPDLTHARCAKNT